MKGKTFGVIGLGLTGCAVIDYLLTQDAKVLVFDEADGKKFDDVIKKYKNKNVTFYFGEQNPEELLKCEKVVISPGVVPTRSWISQAGKSIPVVGELEWASTFLSGTYLAVTGTNGKSTTVSLLSHILREDGFNLSLKGNIGDPLISAVSQPPCPYYVLEVSSYQLETIKTFKPHVAVLLNVTEDHLERYKSFDDYANAKAKITMNQTSEDYFIYNADDLKVSKIATKTKAKKLPYSLVNQFDEGGFVLKNEMIIRFNNKEDKFPIDLGNLTGLHNIENKLAAILSAKSVNCSNKAVLSALKTFKPLAHRLEKVATYHGIDFYDDSKGTNVGAVVMSLASFHHNVILLMGGVDKGGDYRILKDIVKAKVKAILAFGESASLINQALSSSTKFYQVNNMEEAVRKSYEIAKSGDTVLLSPACSSFDQYKNYAERGQDFQNQVHQYKNKIQ